MCGEKRPARGNVSAPWGSPPRVRGKGPSISRPAPASGITPACAGKSIRSSEHCASPWDHPRVCGEKNSIFCPVFSVTGSPPRVRGKAPRPSPSRPSRRITPACAGKSRLQGSNLQLPGDHPRVCGEKHLRLLPTFQRTGSPPRVRGKETVRRRKTTGTGITPACAGKRTRALLTSSRHRDHPRVCGEKEHPQAEFGYTEGSPPRVRGKERALIALCRIARITPACAGKRNRSDPGRHRPQDHPRVCGEKNP